MKNSTKILIVVAVIAVLAAFYSFRYHGNSSVATLSPTGSTNSTAKILSKTMDLSTAAGTSTSILVPQDEAVTSSFAFCTSVATSKTAYTGAGLANLQINGATTSAAITGTIADYNTNYATVAMVIGTSTTMSYASSSSESALVGNGRYLPAASYYSFSANATNTAQCTVGVHVIAL